MKNSSDPVSSFLRGTLAVGRRLRAARSPGSRTLSGLGILGTLYRVGPVVATQLAAEEGLQPQSLTRLLAELEGDRLISRKRSDTDGRAVIITLTAKGQRKLLDEIAERRSWLEAAMAATLTPAEREAANSAAAAMLKIAAYQPQEGRIMTRQSPPGARHVFTGRDLSAAAYTDVKLENAVFKDVNLKHAAFSDINLSGATFANVNMTNVAIRDARLDGMTIHGIPVLELLHAYHDRQNPHAAAADANSTAAESNVVFHVSNLEKALQFYTQILGFTIGFKFGKPETYAGLSWKGVNLHISSSYPYKNNTGHGNLYIFCDETESLYRRLDAAGVDFYSRISDREYGMRDFAIKDPDGNQIGFGTSLVKE
jgi:DNA-binding MarR family transcriptional regulator/catechol 2,3-dioxygenase-like lactoylglutathione lyase family enzyme